MFHTFIFILKEFVASIWEELPTCCEVELEPTSWVRRRQRPGMCNGRGSGVTGHVGDMSEVYKKVASTWAFYSSTETQGKLSTALI